MAQAGPAYRINRHPLHQPVSAKDGVESEAAPTSESPMHTHAQQGILPTILPISGEWQVGSLLTR